MTTGKQDDTRPSDGGWQQPEESVVVVVVAGCCRCDRGDERHVE
jgi:hypothetical protein